MSQDVTAMLERYRSTRRSGSTSRNDRLRKEYGISEAQYEALLRAQGGVCAICHRSESMRGAHGEAQPLSVDHDHSTGRVRGLLCDACNTGVGKFSEEPNRLRAAATYLEHNGSAGQQHQPKGHR